MNSPNEEEIQAYVTLRPPCTEEETRVPVTATSVRRRVAPPEQQQAACQVLEALGFSVERVSPLSIAVKGSKGLFEQVFQGALRPEMNRRPTGSPEVWCWEKAPRIPPELTATVVNVVLPQSVSTHQR